MTMAPDPSSAAERSRLPHVVLDRDTRVYKARKIVALLGEARFQRARRVLEIGCGSGVIASTLQRIGPPGLEVHAVDVVDSRIEREGYAFQLVDDITLPFDDGTFDFVITNHVIEHVGPPDAQLAHLREIHRILAPDGLAYLAVPNRWRLVEPHFRLPLLSWFPQAFADAYVRATGKGTHYDCLPLGHRQAMQLFARAGFDATDRTADALRATLAIEFAGHRAITALARGLPGWTIAAGMPLMPTYVFVLKPSWQPAMVAP